MERLRFGSRKWAKTIAVVEEPLRPDHIGGLAEATRPGEAVLRDTFKIRLAHDDQRTREARFLVEKRYRDVGYTSNAGQHNGQPRPAVCPERITLATYKDEAVVGTLTIGFDTGHGLLADELYRAEIDTLRAQGRRVCEFTKLAFDIKKASKRVLGSLFNVAYLYTAKIWGYQDVIIEVNPSHAGFYKRTLGFQDLGGERHCSRVGAPAVLLRLESDYACQMAERFGGQAGNATLKERSLYPYFMALEQEKALLARMARG